jgi:predicted AAA+ superfamily ATPase
MRIDKGELWKNSCFRLLADKYMPEEIRFWRTADSNEVDFVAPDIPEPFAIEAKFNDSMIKPNKYKKFTETYPNLPLQFVCFEPFNENFFRSILFDIPIF